VFDVMLEAKAKDLALLRLRRDLPRYAPGQAPRFGLDPPRPAGRKNRKRPRRPGDDPPAVA
jgi:UV DNA damage endonuclease